MSTIHISINPIFIHPMKSFLAQIISSKYQINVDAQAIYFDFPPENQSGDYAFACFSLAKTLKKNPIQIAQELSESLQEHPQILESVPVGAYVNFSLDTNYFIKELKNFTLLPKEKRNELIFVDYIGANVGKPLHIGHLCTPSVGQSLINLHRFLGYSVIGDSHIGDWGGIFGKLIYGWQKNVVESASQEADFDKEGVYFLVKIYQKVTALEEADESGVVAEACREAFRRLSSGEESSVFLWKLFTSSSIAELKAKMSLLDVSPDYHIGESFYEGLPLPKLGEYPDLKTTMQQVVAEMLEKNIVQKNEDGSIGAVFPEDSKLPSCVVQKRDGTNLYLTSDLATIKYRFENWKPAKILYCVDVRQQLHFQQCFWLAKNTWKELEQTELTHVSNGSIRLKEGAMSTRKGNVIFLDQLIDEGLERTTQAMKDRNREISTEDLQKIAVGAIKYAYLSQDREKDVVFDWDKALSFEGNSGPYLQYTVVRSKKILEKIGTVSDSIDVNTSLSPQDKQCIRLLLEIETYIQETATKYKPHILAQYLFSLSNVLNSWYANTPKLVEESNPHILALRVMLLQKTIVALETGAQLLAIPLPHHM